MGWNDLEAIEDERFEADMLQAQYEQEGAAYARDQREMLRLRAEGDLAAAAAMCNHTGGYPLDSLAASWAPDPNYGETGFRCMDCGSRISGIGRDAEVLVPCEWIEGTVAIRDLQTEEEK